MQYLSGILRGRSSSSKATEAQMEQAGQLAQDVMSLFEQGKLEELLELLSPDVDFKVPLDLTHPESQQPFAGHSRDEVRQFVKGWTAAFNAEDLTLDDTIVDSSGAGSEAGVFVVNIAHLKCTYKKTGRSIPRCEIAHVMLVSCSQEGKPKIARLEEYSDAAEVLRLLK